MNAAASSLGWVDWVLLAVLGLSVAVGLWRGLVFEVLSLAGWLAAYVVAQAFSSAVAPLVPVGTSGGALNQAAAFALTFIVALLVWAVASRLLRFLIHATPLQLADRVLGGGFGLLRGAVLLLTVATIVSMTPAQADPAWKRSRGAAWLTTLLYGLKPVLPDAIAQHLPA